ncbi:smad nuclear-interacting protein 1 [Alosa pseudoharengus]|uniref:smad nuclear-interacting protein 1 n=1 Tax=Alosa pseudoharengus TaxID=34774 RepID=UPI003F8B456B
MESRKRHKRPESPIRDAKIKIKEEKLSPVRAQRSRRSSSGSNGSSPPRRRGSRSPRRRRDRSPEVRDKTRGGRDKSPPSRSRSSSRDADIKIKREREVRGDEERRRPSRWEDVDDRQVKREAERPRQRERERERERDRDGERDRRGGGGRGGRVEHARERDIHAFQQQSAERQRHDEQRLERRAARQAGNEEDQAFGGPDQEEDDDATAADKEKPNFELSGALVEDTNTFRGVVIKYNEPPEARIPKRRWRLYPFKNDEPLPVMYIHRQSAYLMGRQRKIADIPIDHPSCSKQHAVFQYRLVEHTRADGTSGRRVKPYIIDLGSGNGTYLNNQRIEAQRYYELKEKDVLKFGFSSREYVLLHETSDTSEVDTKQEEDDEDEGLDE